MGAECGMWKLISSMKEMEKSIETKFPSKDVTISLIQQPTVIAIMFVVYDDSMSFSFIRWKFNSK